LDHHFQIIQKDQTDLYFLKGLWDLMLHHFPKVLRNHYFLKLPKDQKDHYNLNLLKAH
jgi:hypothetical protein